jgi:phosphoribosylanthranilate isomerase
LTADNIFDAILATMPWGVDVASGIESAPGIKDGDRMRHFVEEVRRADCHVEHS